MEPVTLVIERHPHASLRARAVRAGARAAARRLLPRVPGGPIDFRRAAAIDQFAGRVPPPRGTRVQRIKLEGFAAEWVHGRGVGADRSKVILYFHGGGWISCGLNTHRRMVARFSEAAGVPALSVDYRMLPEVTFAEEALDCVAAYKWLLDQGVRPEDVIFSGDSAGGYMTFAASLLARAEGLPMPAGLIALSPMVDMDLTAKAAHPAAALDAFSVMPLLDRFITQILDGLDPGDPSVSPVNADLTGLPPTYICCSSSEVLVSDAEVMARRLASHGVPTTLQTWAHQLHVFQMFGPLLPESRASIDAYGDWVRTALGRAAAKKETAA
ncbi:alpha/beta hydrolase [Actinocorallia sp. API 0066]|uniref:alpha/beta hydrolase n=1 Tax=Actinocorallia sp. API 0066 TaxID=2896846 RepID=UPI001E3CA3BA|nr:alpha/beta hydrolase [Actinocorallia sp. API 0066]MCD0448818.1 alpha/beta hydrolase [Actinocorallia sp. API 0066]